MLELTPKDTVKVTQTAQVEKPKDAIVNTTLTPESTKQKPVDTKEQPNVSAPASAPIADKEKSKANENQKGKETGPEVGKAKTAAKEPEKAKAAEPPKRADNASKGAGGKESTAPEKPKVEPKPVEQKPAVVPQTAGEAKPVPGKPGDQKPAEVKPSEQNSREQKPGEGKPVPVPVPVPRTELTEGEKLDLKKGIVEVLAGMTSDLSSYIDGEVHEQQNIDLADVLTPKPFTQLETMDLTGMVSRGRAKIVKFLKPDEQVFHEDWKELVRIHHLTNRATSGNALVLPTLNLSMKSARLTRPS